MTADLSFGSERHGIASWLAAPAPMGSLDFVSADAHMAAAFVVKEPTALLDDLVAMAGQDDDGEGGHDLADVEETLGLSLRDDLAAPLGGEVAVAIDGPFLPEPSWKVIVEVYDPATLQHSIETAVAEADRRSRADGGTGVELTSETSGDRTFYALGKAGQAPRFAYLYVDGYMVVAPSRALLERTLAQRDAGLHAAVVVDLPQPAAERRPRRLLRGLLPAPRAAAVAAERHADAAGRRQPEPGAAGGAGEDRRRRRADAGLRLRRGGPHHGGRHRPRRTARAGDERADRHRRPRLPRAGVAGRRRGRGAGGGSAPRRRRAGRGRDGASVKHRAR